MIEHWLRLFSARSQSSHPLMPDSGAVAKSESHYILGISRIGRCPTGDRQNYERHCSRITNRISTIDVAQAAGTATRLQATVIPATGCINSHYNGEEGKEKIMPNQHQNNQQGNRLVAKTAAILLHQHFEHTDLPEPQERDCDPHYRMSQKRLRFK